MKSRQLVIFPLFLVLYEMATYLSNDLYLPAISIIMHELNISSALTQMTLTAWFLGNASFPLIIGPISDRFGRRPILLYGGIVFVLASLGCGLASNITELLIARFFQGMVACTVVVAGYASIHELLESEQAIKTLAWMGAVAVLAPALGPLIGGTLLLFHGWRVLFFILVVWGVIILLGLKRSMPESLPITMRHSINLKRIFTDYWLIVRCSGFIINTTTSCLIFAIIIAWIVTGPLLVIRDFHLTPLWFGIIQVLLTGSFILGSFIIRHLMRMMLVNTILKYALSIILFGSLLTVILTVLLPNQLFLFVGSFMFVQLGAGMSLAPLNRLAIDSSTQPMGMRVAIFCFLMGWFGVMGSVLASIFYNQKLYSLAWLIFILNLLAIGVKFLTRTRPRTASIG